MTRCIDRLPDGRKIGHDAGIGFDMYGQNRLDAAFGIGAQRLLHTVRVDGRAIVRRDRHGFQAETLGGIAPFVREVAGPGQQYPLAGFHQIDERGFPATMARRGVEKDLAIGAEYRFQIFEHR